MPRLLLFCGKRKAGDCTGAAAAVVETAVVEYEDTEVEFDPHAWRVMPGGRSIQMNPDEVETGTAAEEEASAAAQEASAAAEVAASAAAEVAASAAAEEAESAAAEEAAYIYKRRVHLPSPNHL